MILHMDVLFSWMSLHSFLFLYSLPFLSQLLHSLPSPIQMGNICSLTLLVFLHYQIAYLTISLLHTQFLVVFHPLLVFHIPLHLHHNEHKMEQFLIHLLKWYWLLLILQHRYNHINMLLFLNQNQILSLFHCYPPLWNIYLLDHIDIYIYVLHILHWWYTHHHLLM